MRFTGAFLGSLLLGLFGLDGQLARAQSGAVAAAPFGPPVADQHIYTHLLVNEAEGRFDGGQLTPFRWDAEAWTGTDLNRLWVKSEGLATDGQVSDGDQELLYDRPFSSFFDLQAGLRYDLDSAPGRTWAALGVEGLTPYLFETSATFYISDAGHLAGKLLASYEELLTQRLILEPLLEVNVYSRPDPARDVAAGFSDLEAGIRLRYEISRKFAPYLGAVYQRSDEPSARTPPKPSSGWRLAVGLRAWL